MTHTRRAILAGVLFAAAISSAPLPGLSAADLPPRLTDQQFWQLIDAFSEPGGTFHSDNFVSNEGRFQLVLPELVARAAKDRLYLGVGPEQNFTYMAAVHPRMAFIVDIRRGNLHEHLLYKALIEMSSDRADFLARLFSRSRPSGLDRTTKVEDIFAAYDAVAPTEALYRENLRAVVEWLTKKHALPLPEDDITGIDYVYRSAFFADGPELGYQLTGQGRVTAHPTYAYLMSMDDGRGQQRSYLATEENFQFIKDLESRNLVVPIVGDFGGTKALRAVAKYARDSGAMVSAFYLSNVEQYLAQDEKMDAFCATVASMPLDASSTFIRSRVNGRGLTMPLDLRGMGMFWSTLGSMREETQRCAAKGRGRLP